MWNKVQKEEMHVFEYMKASEINTHLYSLKTGYKNFLSARNWFEELSIIRSYGYKVYPKGLKWYMSLFNYL